MKDSNKTEQRGDEKLEPERAANGKFLAGHAKRGGRKPGSPNWGARAIGEKLNVNPIEIGLEILRDGGYLPPGPGETLAQRRRISPDAYARLVVELTGYLFPKMANVQVTGRDGGPVAVASLDVTALMADPELLDAAQRLGLAMATQQPKQIEAGEEIPGFGTGVRR